MSFSRRNFLLFLGTTAGVTGFKTLINQAGKYNLPLEFEQAATAATNGNLSFKPVQVPLPLACEGLTPQEQVSRYATYQVQDDLLLPEGYEYQVIVA